MGDSVFIPHLAGRCLHCLQPICRAQGLAYFGDEEGTARARRDHQFSQSEVEFFHLPKQSDVTTELCTYKNGKANSTPNSSSRRYEKHRQPGMSWANFTKKACFTTQHEVYAHQGIKPVSKHLRLQKETEGERYRSTGIAPTPQAKHTL